MTADWKSNKDSDAFGDKTPERMDLEHAALRWLNDLSPHGILITDAYLNIRGWNHWLETHSGHKTLEVVGRNLLDVYPELVPRRLYEYFGDALEGQVRVVSQRLHGYLLRMLPVGDDCTFEQMQQSARVAPLMDGDRVVGTITLITDVTERVQREDDLVRLLTRERAARAESEAANRSRDEFLATVSHELRTPLNSILGWIHLLRAGKIEADEAAHALEAVERNAKAQARLIEDLLDASRIVSGELRLDIRCVDLASIIQAAIDTIQPSADAKNIDIHTDIDRNTGVCWGDPNRLEQVVWNLLSNAVKFTPPGGHATVSLRRAGPDVEIAVIDTGAGIRQEFLPFVFDRFRQADSSSSRTYGGLGLGLSIARHLVEMHGGSVRAESAGEGRGSTFTVRLPASVAPAPAQSSTAPPAHLQLVRIDEPSNTQRGMPRLDGIRVLVVDDDLDSREMLATMLGKQGAEVASSATASHALESLRSVVPDVLVSDIGMPGEDGYFLVRRVRGLRPEQGRDVPAIALTGYAGPEDRARLLAEGFQMHMAKPVDFAELAAGIVMLVLESKQHKD